jgi:hypothetical protein
MFVRAAIALALCAQALFVLALTGQLRSVPIVVALAVVALSVFVLERRPPRPPESEIRPRKRPSLHGLACGVLFALSFVLALHPPLAFDETLYHLPYVRSLAESGALRFLPWARFPVFPQLQELLCVPLFLFAGDSATHLMSLLEIALTAGVLGEWARRYDARAAELSVALFLGSPIVVHLATIGYVDPALTLFVTAGASCVDRVRLGETRWLPHAGFLLGTACSVKYLGWFFAAAGLAVVAVHARPWLYAAACAAGALPTTLWITMQTGNPVYPFFGQSARSLGMDHQPWPMLIVKTLRLAWDVTFARERVNQQPPFTPLFLVALALLAAAALRDKGARIVGSLAIGYVAILAFVVQDSRYLVPLLPLIAIVAATTAFRRWPSLPRWTAIVVIAPGLAYAAYRLALTGLPPTSRAARTALLTRRIPEYRALQRAGSDRVFACGAEQLNYHAGGELVGDTCGPYSYARFVKGGVPTSAIATDLARMRVQSFLVAKRVCAPPRSDGGMTLVYEDEAAQLWRVQSSPQAR